MAKPYSITLGTAMFPSMTFGALKSASSLPCDGATSSSRRAFVREWAWNVGSTFRVHLFEHPHVLQDRAQFLPEAPELMGFELEPCQRGNVHHLLLCYLHQFPSASMHADQTTIYEMRCILKTMVCIDFCVNIN